MKHSTFVTTSPPPEKNSIPTYVPTSLLFQLVMGSKGANSPGLSSNIPEKSSLENGMMRRVLDKFI